LYPPSFQADFPEKIFGSQLIAIALLQQEDSVHRSAEKAAPHQGKDAFAQRGVGDAFIEREIRSRQASKSGRLLAQAAGLQAKAWRFPILTKTPHWFSPRSRVLCSNYSQIPGFLSIKSVTFRDHF
jgi:hypothetical protein